MESTKYPQYKGADLYLFIYLFILSMGIITSGRKDLIYCLLLAGTACSL